MYCVSISVIERIHQHIVYLMDGEIEWIFFS